MSARVLSADEQARRRAMLARIFAAGGFTDATLRAFYEGDHEGLRRHNEYVRLPEVPFPEEDAP